MADEKKTVKKEDTSKAGKKPNPFKRIGKAIAKFFKDLRGETKKIVWPGRKMIIKSTGVVLAVILVIGAGIWIIDYAVAKGVTALSSVAVETTTDAADDDEAKEDSEDKTEDESTEPTTEA